MNRFDRRRAARSALRTRPAGLSIVLVMIILVALLGFVSLAVDFGRIRLADAELQTAADAAAVAGVHELKAADAVNAAEAAAINAASFNPNIDTNPQHGQRSDTAINLVPGEDVEFGIWRPDIRDFVLLENLGGGVDERREANAVRAWGRRVTQYTRTDSLGATHLMSRNDGLKLIFAPVLPSGPQTGEIQTRAIAFINGGRIGNGFIGLNSIKFNGTTKTDSYDAARETYPGADGIANSNSAISSNGDIELVGGTQIFGDVHPGVDGSVTPYPLGGNVQVTGYMNPLPRPLTATGSNPDYTIPVWTAPSAPYNAPGGVTPANSLNNATPPAYAPKLNKNNNKSVIRSGKYYFASWTTGSADYIELDNTTGDIDISINGDLKNSAQAVIHLVSNLHQVRFHVNGNFDMQGGGVVNDSAVGKLPSNLFVEVTKANTSVDIGGSPSIYMHLNAPLSDIKMHGNGSGGALGFYGWAVGKSLTVTGSFEAHYDETRTFQDIPYTYRLVK